MAGHYLRKRLRTARFARRLAGFSLILLAVSVLVFRRHGIDFDAFTILVRIVGGLAAFAFVVAVLGLARVWRRGHKGGGAAIAAVFVALVVGVPYALAGVLALRNPPTVTAETDGLAEDEAQDAAPAASGTAGVDEDALSGRVFAARSSQVYQAVRLVLGDVGWTVSGVEATDPQEEDYASPPVPDDEPPPSGPVPVPTPRNLPGEEPAGEAKAPDPLDQPESAEYRIAAVAASPILLLPSDVEIRIVEDDSQAYLDLRSTSRFGSQDFGQNRRFIEDFLARADAAMVGVASPSAGR